MAYEIKILSLLAIEKKDGAPAAKEIKYKAWKKIWILILTDTKIAIT